MEKKIFCVIPAFNEEKNIVKVIEELKKYINNIIVIDDGSSDNTYQLAKNQNIIALKHLSNRGQGAALQTGNEYALKKGADIIIHFDADGQFLASEINNLINPILYDNFDIIFGSRFLEKENEMPALKKKFIMPLARLMNFIFFNIKFSDPQCGFRAMTAGAAQKIIIEQDGMAHCTEILAKAHINNFRAKEVPITVIYFNFGQKFSGGLKIIKDLFLAKILE